MLKSCSLCKTVSFNELFVDWSTDESCLRNPPTNIAVEVYSSLYNVKIPLNSNYRSSSFELLTEQLRGILAALLSAVLQYLARKLLTMRY
jgi:hypothetical protein